MRFRKLRIAWSVLCSLACVLLIVLWVRSYWWCDDVIGPFGTTRSFCVWSDYGHVGCSLTDERLKSLAGGGPWALAQEWTGNVPTSKHVIPWLPSWAAEHCVVVPDWGLALLIGAGIAAPWIRCSKRFSLRTLLIATTLVAVVLGLGAYAARK
jgi:hypothetical protein